MKSHLDIKVNGKSLVLPKDFSISGEEQNPIFNDAAFFSYPCTVKTKANLAVLKNIAHRDSNLRGMDYEHASAQIFADGLPLNTGQVVTNADAEIGPDFQFDIDAQQQSFSDLISGLDCRDVDISNKDILIGEKIGKIHFSGNIHTEEYRNVYDNEWNPANIYWGGDVVVPAHQVLNSFSTEKDFEIDSPQALGFSFPGKCAGFPAAGIDDNGNPIVLESYINVSKPYPFPYCNARVAYAHHALDADGQTKDEIVKGNERNPSVKEDWGQYWCLDANRPQSGICFYVLYFLDCLFEQLGVTFNKDELLEVEDLKRLAFFTTLCKYDEREIRNEQYPDGKVLVNEEIQEWLNSRNCGGSIDFKIYAGETKRGRYEDAVALPATSHHEEMDYRTLRSDYTIIPGEPFDNAVPGNPAADADAGMFEYVDCYNVGAYYIGGSLRHVMYYRHLYGKIDAETEVYEMYANSDNFPDATVSSVIESLEASFGIRFLYDPEKRTVTARLLRNVYKETKINKFNGIITSMVPVNEKITGVRMAYSAESDQKEQRNNVRYGVRDYDTDYDYIDFPEDRTIVNLTYSEINNASIVNSTNRNVYVDLTTGNVYRIKIDAQAEDAYALRPVLFQVGQFKGIEEGDCSEQNTEFVKEFISNFTPISLNVINAKEYNTDKTGNVSPILAPYLDVDMENEKVPHVIESSSEIDISIYNSSYAFPRNIQLALRENLLLTENYDPTQTDDGNSPLQDIDWGLTIAVMRGAGSDGEIVNYDRGYDGFDNSRWKDTIATYEMTSDTMDYKGAIYDYNGSDDGDGGGERFSLSIRSWASFVYYIDQDDKIHISRDTSLAGKPVEGTQYTWLIPCDDDERNQQGKIINKIRSRGLCDTFMRPHFHFLLFRKKYKIEALTTVAQLMDIRNHWSERYIIDGKVGFVNKLNYDISAEKGIGKLVIEFYSL